MQSHTRYSIAKRTTLIGAAINALLGFVKLCGGILFNSHALVADGVHSFSDLLTDILVLFAAKYGGQHTDTLHPYGHQRIETASTFFLAMLLIVAGAGIALDGLNFLLHPAHDLPLLPSLLIAALSIVVNEALFHYTLGVSVRIESAILRANAWHHRSDAGSSLIAFTGLAGSLFGFWYLDAVAAIIVGMLIIKIGVTLCWNSIKELVDTGVEPNQLRAIQAVICAVDGVKKIHQLRNRLMGQDIFVDVHVLVSPTISVSEGHFIAQNVHYKLIKAIPEVKDVTVHIDPEDDEETPTSVDLPNRHILEEKLLRPWQRAYPSIRYWILHYLDGMVTVDLYCNANPHATKELITHINSHLDEFSHCLVVRFFSIQ